MASFVAHAATMTTATNVQSRERTDLLESLDKHRNFLRQAVQGITDEQAALRPTASELCLGGLIKHVAHVEATWANFIVEGPARLGPIDEAAIEAHRATFRMHPGETLQGLLDGYEDVARRTTELVESLPS